MADPKGFMTTDRELPTRRPVDIRLQDWRERQTQVLSKEKVVRRQTAIFDKLKMLIESSF